MLIWLGTSFVVVGFMLLLHLRLHTMRWFWRGLAFLIGWSVFLSLVPGGAHMSPWWIPLDAPLNFGWMLCWAWPMIAANWIHGRQQRQHIKSNFALVRQAVRDARVQRKAL